METETESYPDKVPSIGKRGIIKLAEALLRNEIFTSQQAGNNVGSVFMVLMLGALLGAPKSYLDDIGMIYEYYDKAGPMSVNGMPIFFSCNLVNKADWVAAVKKWRQMEKALGTVLNSCHKIYGNLSQSFLEKYPEGHYTKYSEDSNGFSNTLLSKVFG